MVEDTSYKRVVGLGSIPPTPILSRSKLMVSYETHVLGVGGSNPSSAIWLRTEMVITA